MGYAVKTGETASLTVARAVPSSCGFFLADHPYGPTPCAAIGRRGRATPEGTCLSTDDGSRAGAGRSNSWMTAAGYALPNSDSRCGNCCAHLLSMVPARWRTLFPPAAAYPHGTHLLPVYTATRAGALVNPRAIMAEREQPRRPHRPRL